VGTWPRRTVATLVLAVLCAAPALATACELLCAAQAGAVAHDAASTALSSAAPEAANDEPPSVLPARHRASSVPSCHEPAQAPAKGATVAATRTDCAFHHGGSAAGLAAVSPARADADQAAAPGEAVSIARVPARASRARADRPWLVSPPGPPSASRGVTVLRI
jgi:hypothetical protein